MFANRNNIMNIYNHITESKKKQKKLFALLVDPDKQEASSLIRTVEKAKLAQTDLFFVGGHYLLMTV